MKWRATSILCPTPATCCLNAEETGEASFKLENFIPNIQIAIGRKLCFCCFIVLPHFGKCYIIFCPQVLKCWSVEYCIPLIPHFNLLLPTSHTNNSTYLILTYKAINFKINFSDVLEFGISCFIEEILSHRLKLNNINLKPTLWFQGQASFKSLFKIIT